VATLKDVRDLFCKYQMVYSQFMLYLLQMVTIDNVEEYVDLVTDFCLNVGIRRQMEALKGQHDSIIIFVVVDIFNVA